MMMVIEDLQTEFNENVGTLKRIQAKVKMKLENPITQLGNSEKRFTSRMSQAEVRILESSR